MKKFLLFALLFTVLAGSANAQEKQRKSPHDTVSTANITVTYGRPYKKDRVVFGGLEKYDKVWRTGADEATEITFKKAGTFAGKPVKAGTYTLFTIPSESNEWTVILNSSSKQWGAYEYENIKGKDVLNAKVAAKKTDKVVEQLTITPTDKAVTIAWDQTEVSIPVKF
jgi:hypothetical protein